MQRRDIQLANSVLGMLRNGNQTQLITNSPATTASAPSNPLQLDGCALFEFNHTTTPVIDLPTDLKPLAPALTEHIGNSAKTVPWGLIETDCIALTLFDDATRQQGRLLLFTMECVDSMLSRLFPNERISRAEKRTMLQCLSGMSMAEAAAQDGLAHDTKRTQLRMVFEKTRFKKQQQLSSFLVTHLTMELASSHARRHAAASSDDTFFHYVDQFMGEHVRASVVQESATSRHRIIELGDLNGTPVVCVHHLGLVNFSKQEIDEFRRRRIKLIFPLRHGALGPSDSRLTEDAHLAHALAGIHLATNITGQARMTILSMLSGCWYALAYAKQHPERVDNLVMLGANYKSKHEPTSNSALKNLLHSLATDHADTFERTVTQLVDNVDDIESLKAIVKASCDNGTADNAAFDKLFYDPVQVRALQYRLKHSSTSILNDLLRQAHARWSDFPTPPRGTSLHFVHGDRDALIPYEGIRHLAQRLDNSHVHTVQGAGNWLFGDYTAYTATRLRAILDNSA